MQGRETSVNENKRNKQKKLKIFNYTYKFNILIRKIHKLDQNDQN